MNSTMEYSYINLPEQWEAFLARRKRWSAFPGRESTRNAFRQHIFTVVEEWERYRLLREPKTIVFCRDCHVPGTGPSSYWRSDMSGVGDEWACGSCLADYSQCGGGCWQYHPTESMNLTLTGRQACDDCLVESWVLCQHCNGYRHVSAGYEHIHGDPSTDICDQGACCTSPAKQFTVRNDGHEPLANDVHTEVALGAGMISNEGIAAMASYIQMCARAMGMHVDGDEGYRTWYLAGELENVGVEWQAKGGTFPKRLSSYAYKTKNKLKLSKEMLSEIGNLASDHSRGATFEVAVTRNINLPAEEFANSGSCWWSEYGHSRCALKTNGGFGLRSFGEQKSPVCNCHICRRTSQHHVNGRVWVMPLRKVRGTKVRGGSLVATFETQEPSAFVVFNGYGALQGYAGARVLAQMAGLTYRKIGFTMVDTFVNNNAGYLVAPEEIAAQYTADGSQIHLDLTYHSDLFLTEQKRAQRTTQRTTKQERILTNA